MKQSMSDMMDRVKAAAEKFFEGAAGSHGWDHTLRVLRLCERIGPVEGADMEVLRVAACLHDIGRPEEDATRGRVCHAARSAELCVPLLSHLPLSRDRKENVLHAIRTHRFRGEEPPRTPEAKVLFDADKLDAIGAVGVARTFLFAGEVGARLYSPEIPVEHTRAYSRDDTGFREYRLKLCRIRERMLTGEGIRLSRSRHEFMEFFFDRFLEEWNGNG